MIKSIFLLFFIFSSGLVVAYLNDDKCDTPNIRRSTSQQAETKRCQYEKAAKRGDVNAQINLAHMYSTGEEIPVNLKQARYWYGEAARQGDPASQLHLGVMIHEGKGGFQSCLEATDWFRKALVNSRTSNDSRAGLIEVTAEGYLFVIKQQQLCSFRGSNDL